jgi:hypothetical protein
MTQTLRRELRKGFAGVIVKNGITSEEGIKSDFWQAILTELAISAEGGCNIWRG